MSLLSSTQGPGFNPIVNRWEGEPQLAALPPLPLVSVIVPSYQQGRFIGETIRSILEQSYRHLDVIVVDGASRDETLDVLAQFSTDARLRVLSEPDKGVADAVNKGFGMARGEVFAIQSSDDIYTPGAIEAAVSALLEEDRPGIVYGDIVKVDESCREIARPQSADYSLEALLSKATYIPQPAAFFRAELVQQVGPWNTAYFNCDTEFWLRALWQAPVRKINRAMSMRRMHGEQRDTQRAKISESYARMIDTSPQIRSLPAALRRAARAGKFLHRLRYNPRPSTMSDRALLWKAVLTYPRLLSRLEARYRLLPYGAEMLAWAGRVRRWLRSP